MQTHRVFSSKLAGIMGSLVIAVCLTFTPSLYEAARGVSTASVSSAASNVASKGDRLTTSHLRTSVRTAARPEGVTANYSGKIPVGCEAAVSRLIHSADFRARRCVT
jgi:hypothetical protein